MMDEQILPSEKFWRTLVRITKQSENFVYFVVPAWNAFDIVCVRKVMIPKEIRETLEIHNRYHVECNIGEEVKHKLKFKNWEPSLK